MQDNIENISAFCCCCKKWAKPNDKSQWDFASQKTRMMDKKQIGKL